MKIKLIISLLALNLVWINLYSQIINPVKWEFNSVQVNENVYDLQFKAIIDESWHIYAQEPNGGMNPTTFTFEEKEGYELMGKVTEPENFKRKYDEIFKMEYNLYSKSAIFKQKVKLLSDKANVTGYVEFFSCDDQRCLPPKEVDFEFKLNQVITAESKSEIEKPVEKEKKEEIQEPRTFDLAITLENTENAIKASETTSNDEPLDATKKGLLGLFLIGFLGGLGALLTPCVYPIIPLTVSFFMRGESTKRKSVTKGLAFGISIILIYTLIGFLTGLLRLDLTKLASSWIANSIFFTLFIVFAFSFFGMFELVLPSSWANKIDSKADKGGFAGPFFMALATVIISFSCTGPIVGVLLGQSLQGEIIQPVVGMFGFSVAFALPFTLLAIFPGMLQNLPKSGGWLNSVKVFFAFILLAFSLKFLSNIDQLFHLQLLNRTVFIAIWISLFILLGLYLLGKIKFSHDSDLNHISVGRLMFIIASFTFAVYMVPGLFGAPLKAISFFLPPKTGDTFDLTSTRQNEGKITSQQDYPGLCGKAKYSDFLHLPHGLKGYYDYEEGMECARQLNKPVFLDFKGHTCTNCKAMEERVWSNTEVLSRLKNDFVIIALYVDDRTKLAENEIYTSEFDGKKKNTLGKKNADLQVTRFNTNALPYYVIINHEGKKLTEPKTTDFNIQHFADFLEKGKLNFYNQASYYFN